MKIVRAEDIESTTNKICEQFAELGAKLTIKLLKKAEVLIKGDANSLKFLANYILAYVNGEEHAQNINPKSAGSIFFHPDSTKGLYIHILPCRHGHEKE